MINQKHKKCLINHKNKIIQNPVSKGSINWANLERWRLLIHQICKNFHHSSLTFPKNHLNICLIVLMMLQQEIDYGFNKKKKKSKKWGRKKNKKEKENNKFLILQQSKFTRVNQMFSFQDSAKRAWLIISKDYHYWKKDPPNQIWIKMIQ